MAEASPASAINAQQAAATAQSGAVASASDHTATAQAGQSVTATPNAILATAFIELFDWDPDQILPEVSCISL